MNLKPTWACALPLLAGLTAFAQHAYASNPSFDCTPAVYAFRHAEDSKTAVAPFPCLPGSSVNCTTALTPVGMMHADLYLEMVKSFELTEDICPIKHVYAVNPINPDGFGGTTNPYFTGKPMSDVVTNLAPVVEINGNRIDQRLTVVKPATLRSLMLGIVKSGASVALFWTSEGLHDLGLALGTSTIPVKTDTASPPRNAAYIFKYNGGNALTPPTKATQFVQCFNYTSNGAADKNFTGKFYCGTEANGNLSAPVTDFAKLHGRICDRDAAGFKVGTSPTGYFGYCKSPG